MPQINDHPSETRPNKFDFVNRNRAQVYGFLDGLDVLTPGVTVVSQWWNPATDPPLPEHVSVYGGLARKPGTP